MADITMCATKDCPLSGTCYRKTAEASEHQSRQEYLFSRFNDQVSCSHYILDHQPACEVTPASEPAQDTETLAKRLIISEGAPVAAIEWAQGPCGSKTNETRLRLEVEDEGGGAFFSLKTLDFSGDARPVFYFDSGDDLRRLADLVDGLLEEFTNADVFG